MLIIGLGNIGKEYEKTKHNVGFMCVDQVAIANNTDFKLNKKLNCLIADYIYNGKKHYIIKPTTFMNSSGLAVNQVMEYYNIKKEEIIVIYDDLDLPVSKKRIRKNGSSGGHNGIKSIISHIKSDEFSRIRIGIGKNSNNIIDYVLTPFSVSDQKLINGIVEEMPNIIDDLTTNDINYIMNKYNG